MDISSIKEKKLHYDKIKDYYNVSTSSWINTYRRVESFRFSPFLKKHDDILYNKIFLNKSATVLDAGCGDFSLSIHFLTKNKDLFIHGVTLSDVQKNIADKNIKKYNVANRAKVTLQNFNNLNFKNNFFDVIYFIESFSHSIHKEKTIEEIYRVLKPKGLCYILDLNLKSKLKYKKQINNNYLKWYNLFYFVPIPYDLLKHKFRKKFNLLYSNTNLTNYRKHFYRKLRQNVDFERCENYYKDSNIMTDYGKSHAGQENFELPVVWSEFLLQK
jgi:ubiquinone/menaquinone biosynthesis C-methylase UbiE